MDSPQGADSDDLHRSGEARAVPPEQFRRGVLFAGAMCFALSVILGFFPLLTFSPSASDVVGRITVDGYPKSADYAGGTAILLGVPLIGYALYRAARMLRDLLLRHDAALGLPWLCTALVAAPLFIAPFVHFITRDRAWSITFPLVLLSIHVFAAWLLQRGRWSDEIITARWYPYHVLLLSEGAAAMLFTYLIRQKRIASAKTLFLELPIIAVGVFGVWIVGLVIARIITARGGGDIERTVRGVALGGTPLLILPIFGLVDVVREWFGLYIIVIAAGIWVAVWRRWAIEPSRLRRLLVWWIIPGILFCASLGGIAWAWNWSDLFHRGESLGPASDYLLGKLPYRDVFVLHGLLENGWLDASLMQLFGRDATVSTFRIAAMGALVIPATWLLAIVVFDSIPIALLMTASSWLTFAGSHRPVLLIVSALLLIAGLAGSRRLCVLAAGAAGALALFVSLEIGLYSLAGGVLAIVLDGLLRRGDPRRAAATLRALAFFSAGAIAATLPFIAWMGARGILDDFWRVSFVEIPALIEPAWALPFPPVAERLVQDRSVRGIAQWLLSFDFRFLLTGIVLIAAIARLIARRAGSAEWTSRDRALLVLSLFALLLQRSSMGRADFAHQLFSAALTGPILVLLLVEAYLNARRQPSPWREGSVALIGAVVLLAAAVLWLPDIVASRIDETMTHRTRLGRKGTLNAYQREVRQRINAFRDAIERQDRNGTTMFDFSNQPALYFFAGRRNPTPYYQVPVMSSRKAQRQVIELLEQDRTRLILKRSADGFDRFDGISNDDRARAVASYISDKYMLVEQIEGTEIWRRREDRLARSIDEYMKTIRPPGDVGPPLDQWLLFPVAVNLTVGESKWVTDISIHNPKDVPIEVRLGYHAHHHVFSDVRVEPRQTLVLKDVVRTHFFSDGSRGSVMLRYGEGRKPFVTAVTYDMSSKVPPAVERPFDASDAARAGTPETLVLTATQTAGRRINIGVVNTGERWASFRIRAVSPSGEEIAQFEGGSAPELTAMTFSNANAPLPVPFEEGGSLIIEPRRGQIIAYATVTDLVSGESRTIRAHRMEP